MTTEDGDVTTEDENNTEFFIESNWGFVHHTQSDVCSEDDDITPTVAFSNYDSSSDSGHYGLRYQFSINTGTRLSRC